MKASVQHLFVISVNCFLNDPQKGRYQLSKFTAISNDDGKHIIFLFLFLHMLIGVAGDEIINFCKYGIVGRNFLLHILKFYSLVEEISSG